MLELQNSKAQPFWQITQFHAYHIASSGIQFDWSYWVFNRSFLFITNGWFWHGVLMDITKGIKREDMKDATNVYGLLVQTQDKGFAYAEGTEEKEFNPTLRATCALTEHKEEPTS
jgi:hypothetical protein